MNSPTLTYCDCRQWSSEASAGMTPGASGSSIECDAIASRRAKSATRGRILEVALVEDSRHRHRHHQARRDLRFQCHFREQSISSLGQRRQEQQRGAWVGGSQVEAESREPGAITSVHASRWRSRWPVTPITNGNRGSVGSAVIGTAGRCADGLRSLVRRLRRTATGRYSVPLDGWSIGCLAFSRHRHCHGACVASDRQ